MPKMIATKAITYDRKTIQAGEEFEVDANYVGTLASLGRATLVDENGEKASTKVGATGTKSTAKEQPKEPLKIAEVTKPSTEPAKSTSEPPTSAEGNKPASDAVPGAETGKTSTYKTRQSKAEGDK